jgi:hypothetical protein
MIFDDLTKMLRRHISFLNSCEEKEERKKERREEVSNREGAQGKLKRKLGIEKN